MAIYKLPSHSPRKYTGKYPTRVNSFGGRKGVYHFELNNGSRYVCNGRDLDPMLSGTYSREFLDCLAYSAVMPVEMRLADYAAVIFIARLFRILRGLPSNLTAAERLYGKDL